MSHLQPKTPPKSSISMFGVVIHDIQRLGSIAAILGKYGFGRLITSIRSAQGKSGSIDPSILEDLRHDPNSTAANLRLAIEELGTTYIKFGQMLSTRGDILPKHFIQELAKLQNSLPPLPFETIEKVLNTAYGDYHQHFLNVDSEPIAAASIAQVHRATTNDGQLVVLKIQRPDLLPLIRSDIDILRFLAKAAHNLIEEIAYFNLPEIIDEFEQAIVGELDFRHERDNIDHFSKHYADWPELIFPDVLRDLSSDKILVMHEIHGVKISETNTDSAYAKDLSQTLLRLAYEMVFVDGVFHADPHPGNVFACEDGRLALLDFGLVGSFSQRQREQLVQVILAAHLGDCAQIARSLLQLGQPMKRVVLIDLESDIAKILHKYLRNQLKDIDVSGFANDFISAGLSHAIQIPSEFTRAVRALLSLVGIVQHLDPELDIMATLQIYAKRLFRESMTREKISAQGIQAGMALTDFLRQSPSHIAQIMQDLENEGLAIRLEPQTFSPLQDAINALSTRVSISLMLLGLTFVFLQAEWPVSFAIFLVADALWILILGTWHWRSRISKKRFQIGPYLSYRKRRQRWF